MVSILLNLASAIIGLIIGTLLLVLVAKIFKLEGNFLTSLKINGIASIVVFIFGFISQILSGIIAIILVIFLIKKFYNIKFWSKTFGVWIVWFIFDAIIIILTVVIALFVGVFKLAQLFST